MRMKMAGWKFCQRAALVVAALCLVAAKSQAALVLAPNDIIKFTNGPGTNGEFIVQLNSNNTAPDPDDSFRTFCVQTNENLNFPPASFRVLGINTFSVNPVNALALKTAELYNQFRTGRAIYDAGGSSTYSFFGGAYTYNYAGGATNNSDANLLQQAIWYFQGQGQPMPGFNAATNKFILAVNAYASTNTLTLGTIRILNLAWESPNNGAPAQDVLVDTRNFQVAVPEPGSLAIFGLGLVGAAAFVRRRKA